MRTGPPALAYLDAREALGRPHVVVDGAAMAGTKRCLSHWPASPTPRPLWRDLSTESALAYLAHRRFWALDAVAVTNDHLDEDGLAGLFALVSPESAERVATRLVALARAGDFGDERSPEAVAAVLALRGLFDPDRSPLATGASRSERDPMAWAATCYRAGLELLPELLDHPDRFASWGADEAAVLAASDAAIESGAVTLVEDRALDLLVAQAGRDLSLPEFERGQIALPLHPMALHRRSEMARVLVLLGPRVSYYDRYETWVRYLSVRHLLRRDLAPLASALGAREPGGTAWVAEPPGALVPVLAPVAGRSELGPDAIVAALRAHLRAAPPAWDPFARTLAGVRVSGPAAPRSETTGRGPFRWRGPRPRRR